MVSIFDVEISSKRSNNFIGNLYELKAFIVCKNRFFFFSFLQILFYFYHFIFIHFLFFFFHFFSSNFLFLSFYFIHFLFFFHFFFFFFFLFRFYFIFILFIFFFILCFNIIQAEHANLRTQYFIAESKESMDDWVKVLSQSAQMLNSEPHLDSLSNPQRFVLINLFIDFFFNHFNHLM